MYQTVTCSQQRYPVIVPVLPPAYPQLQKFSGSSGQAELCQALTNRLGLAQLPDSAYQIPTASVPTLLMSGQFDPVTPHAFAQHIARNLPKAYEFLYPGLGHGTFFHGKCPGAMAAQFVENLNRAPESKCISTMPTLFRSETVPVN